MLHSHCVPCYSQCVSCYTLTVCIMVLSQCVSCYSHNVYHATLTMCIMLLSQCVSCYSLTMCIMLLSHNVYHAIILQHVLTVLQCVLCMCIIVYRVYFAGRLTRPDAVESFCWSLEVSRLSSELCRSQVLTVSQWTVAKWSSETMDSSVAAQCRYIVWGNKGKVYHSNLLAY